MRRICILIISIAFVCTAAVFSETLWEGNAAMGQYGEFPDSGYYGASNTFARNTVVKVTNMENSKSVRVIIVKEVDDPGILLLVSDEAGRELGMARNTPVRVKAVPVSSPDIISIDPRQDKPYSPDPDINPAASMGDPNERLIDERLTEAPEEEKAEESDESPEAAAKEGTEEAADESAEPEAAAETAVSEVQPEKPEETAEKAEEEAAGLIAEGTILREERAEPEKEGVVAEGSVEQKAEEKEGLIAEGSIEAPAVSEEKEGVIAEGTVIRETEAEEKEGTIAEGRVEKDETDDEAEEAEGVVAEGTAVSESETAEPEEITATAEEFETAAEETIEEETIEEEAIKEEEQPEAAAVAEDEADTDESASLTGTEDEMPRQEIEEAEPELDAAAAELPSPAEDIIVPPRTAFREEVIVITRIPEPRPPQKEKKDDTEGLVEGLAAERLAGDPLASEVKELTERRPEKDLFRQPSEGELFSFIEAPQTPESDADYRPEKLAEAVPEPEEKPSLAYIGPLTPPEPEIDSALAAPEVPKPAHIADIEPIDAPSSALDLALAEALPPEEEQPDVADLGPLDEPPLSVDAEPAEAVPEKGEKPAVADLGPRKVSEEAAVTELAEAEVKTETGPGERPDDDIRAISEEEVELVLEPAELRPPQVPEPETGSLSRIAAGEDAGEGDFALKEPAVGEGPERITEEDSLEKPLPIEEAEVAMDTEKAVPEVPEASDSLPAVRAAEEEESAVADARHEPQAPEAAGEEPEAVAEKEAAGEEPTEEDTGIETVVAEVVKEIDEEIAAAEDTGEISREEKPEAKETVYLEEAGRAEPKLYASEWARKNLPLVNKLEEASYYLQVGAFKNPESAKDAIEEIAPGFPQIVLPIEKADETVYRVFVGPLNEDESGIILYQFRSKGYKDAFIRKGGTE